MLIPAGDQPEDKKNVFKDLLLSEGLFLYIQNDFEGAASYDVNPNHPCSAWKQK
ncbi:hypothetical protein JMA_07130 [Jeotgalibacillus malaysiensis]|uniref:Uncharacterized protein n=1 Tax=Jeotgalibacillus malaysiensis TaxID=1508404 RepID=A0A0B5AI04_9BACL|nr:hypothetical protein JMA_07130 [Jeotgalibacillus malaysiensis]